MLHIRNKIEKKIIIPYLNINMPKTYTSYVSTSYRGATFAPTNSSYKPRTFYNAPFNCSTSKMNLYLSSRYTNTNRNWG